MGSSLRWRSGFESIPVGRRRILGDASRRREREALNGAEMAAIAFSKAGGGDFPWVGDEERAPSWASHAAMSRRHRGAAAVRLPDKTVRAPMPHEARLSPTPSRERAK